MWKNVPCGKVKVLYPPVKLFSYNENSKRENIIVIFSRISYEKNIDILVETFNKHYSGQGLKLCILGSVNTKENQDYLEILKSKAANNITFVINPSRDTIQNIFDRALIFWHSMGYGKTDNFFFEHFGITTVEAMSSGLIPIVINKGGQSEIVDHYTNGFKWDSLEELIYFTNYFLKLTLDEKKMLSKKAVQKASCFSYEKFKLNFNAIILDYFKERLYET
jgi:glycosyltransferase involved in cell wall biosynthesis